MYYLPSSSSPVVSTAVTAEAATSAGGLSLAGGIAFAGFAAALGAVLLPFAILYGMRETRPDRPHHQASCNRFSNVCSYRPN
ncbi:MAG: hypothetical protein ABH859_00165 [Pseudomonadota bacterium]